MNEQEIEEVILLTIPMLQTALERPATPIPQHESIRTGAIHYEELMTSPNPALFRNAARMDKETFNNLLNLLRTEAFLMDNKLLSAGEKLMIFLEALVGHSNRTIADLWQHSGSTISETIHEVSDWMKRPTMDRTTIIMMLVNAWRDNNAQNMWDDYLVQHQQQQQNN